MDYFALLLPLLLVVGLIVGLVFLKRHLFSEPQPQAPIPIPDLIESAKRPPETKTESPLSAKAEPAVPASADNGLLLSPARLYPRRPLSDTEKAVFSRLLKALPGYVVLPKITYDHFLEARDGSASENKSLHNRAAQHLADFIVCDRKLHVLLVCQIEDGKQVPARIQEREKMLQKAGLRLLRWSLSKPPDPSSVLNTVRTLEKLGSPASQNLN